MCRMGMKALIFLAMAALGGAFHQEESRAMTASEIPNEIMIEKAKMDTREYKSFVMENGLPVVCIRDTSTSKSSASIDIAVGSFWDPPQIPGVAHFLEHLLFLGSEKYPKIGAFDRLLAENGGYSNAYTAEDHTNYFFAVETTQFVKSAKMFGQMFSSPLLSMNSTKSEAHAIDSEHNKNHQEDGWRIEQVKQMLGKPGHPYRHFGTGNKETLLSDVDASHAAVEQLFHGHYCVKNMKVTMLSNLPLDEIADLAKESFAEVPLECSDSNDKSIRLGERMGKLVKGNEYLPPYNETILGSLVHLRTLSDLRELSMLWQIPPQQNLWKAKSAEYVGQMISNEGPGSLLAHLRGEKSYVSSLRAGLGEDYQMFSTFEVEISLTPAGAAKIPYIVEAVQSYINLMQNGDGVSDWRWEEMKQNTKVSFDYKEKESPEDYTSSVASSMRVYPLRKVLSADTSFLEYDSEAISNLLASFKPEKMLVFYCARHPNLKLDFKEKYYGVEYSVSPLPESFMSFTSAGSTFGKILSLPEANEYVVNDTSIHEQGDNIVKREDETAQPMLISNDYLKKSENTRSLVWWVPDTRFSMPHTTVIATLYKPKSFSDPVVLMSAQMFAALASDSLRIETDAATSAGYQYSISATNNGLQLQVSGFAEHLPKFLSMVLTKLEEPEKLLRRERFDTVKTLSLLSMKNSLLSEPYKLISPLLNEALETPHINTHESLIALNSLDFDKTVAFKNQLNDVFLELFIFGNANLEDARMIEKAVHESLPVNTKSKELLEAVPVASEKKVTNLKQSITFRGPPTDVDNPNSCVLNYWQYGKEGSQKDRLYLSALAAIAHGPVYNTLRTQEQLGYIVGSGAKKNLKVLGLTILVESQVKSAKEVEARINHFVANVFNPLIENLKEERFQQVIGTLRSQLKQPPQTPSDVMSTAFSEISAREYKFNRKKEQLKLLDEMNLAGLKTFYQKLINSPMVSLQLDPKLNGQEKDLLIDEQDEMHLYSCNEEKGLSMALKKWRFEQEDFGLIPVKSLPECTLCS